MPLVITGLARQYYAKHNELTAERVIDFSGLAYDSSVFGPYGQICFSGIHLGIAKNGLRDAVDGRQFADQKLVIDSLSSDLRVVREKVDDNNVRIGSLTQELESVRRTVQSYSTVAPAVQGPAEAASNTPGGEGQTVHATAVVVERGEAELRGVEPVIPVGLAAHRGALTHGRTAAVLGSGPDWIYPKAHEGLADEIAANGVVLSEYPPGTAPLPFHFPQRNRLISGLSRAVVLVEAAEKSGSLITAACALEQGRDVMVVPGNPLTGRNRGGHALLRDGAKIVESADDIVEELGTDLPCLAGQPTETSDGASMASGDIVARAMVPDVRYELEDLRARTGLETPVLLAHLADLELAGSVRRLAGGSFIRLVRTC